MMKNNFITASANINDMDEDAKKFPIVTQTEKNVELKFCNVKQFWLWWN